MDNTISEKIRSFFSAYPTTSYTKGDVLIEAGENPQTIFYLEEGIVRCYWLSQEGTETTLNLFKPQSFFPMSYAMTTIANKYFYEALSPLKGKHAPKEDVLAFLQKEPDVLYDLLRRLYTGTEGLLQHIVALSTGNASVKLITSLLILAKRFGETAATDTVITIKMNEQEIANYVGISRETASRELQKLKQQNIVSFDKGHITIKNMKLLEKEEQAI